jgi:hypothetical protein
MEVEEVGASPGKIVDVSIDERRRCPRVACEGHAEAVLVQREALFRGQIRDISEGGCYVDTVAEVHVTPGMEIDLRFTLQDNYFHFEAMVMNVREGAGFGLRFLAERSPAETELLHCLMQVLLHQNDNKN